MLLSELLKKTDLEYSLTGDADIAEICYDSRKAKEGSLFFCLTGSGADGHDYAESAYKSGCRAFAAERPLGLPNDASVVLFKNTRMALAYVSAAFFGHPAREMLIVGITGTKGKTTVANMVYSCLNRSGIPAGYIGTSGILYAGKSFETKNTTPESFELHRTFRDMLESGVRTAVIEVSSQALFNYRVDGIGFDVGVFTNLSPDHIGPAEHPTFSHYLECKKRLFSLCRFGIFNADDGYCPDMMNGSPCEKSTYGIKSDCDFRASDIESRKDGTFGISFRMQTKEENLPVVLPFPGEYSVLNALATAAVCERVGLSGKDVAEALRDVSVPGRFETVPMPAYPDRTFILDYAHNEVSMRTLLETVRSYKPKRIVCLFGSVGDRTKNRRRELGDVASRLADFCIITSDNPGFEEPQSILDEIAERFTEAEGSCPFVKIADREEAVRYAVLHSEPGDAVLFCGKGHETYQLVRGERVPFSEKKILLAMNEKN